MYYTLGNAYAEQLAAATDGKLKATAAETGASVQNIQQLVADQYQVAFSLFDTATDAVDGTGCLHRAAAGQGVGPDLRQLHPGDRPDRRRHHEPWPT